MPDNGTVSKSVSYLVYDPAGTTLLGTWNDAPMPSFRRGVDGVDSLRLDLPRTFGRADEPGEPGGTGTLAPDNRVEVWVADADTGRGSIAVGIVGLAEIGVSPVDSANALGTLIFGGYIASTTLTPPAGATAEIISDDHALTTTPIAGEYTATGDPEALALDVLATYAPGFDWDSRNPATAGTGDVSVSFKNQNVWDALRALRDLCGPGWLLTVTPRRAVRLFEPDTTVEATHILSRVASPSFVKDTSGRAKEIIVTYADGQNVSARAVDFYTANPRTVFFAADHLDNETDARALAANKLAELDRVSLRGEVTVPHGIYDIEAIDVGDTVRVHQDRPMSAGFGVGALVGYATVGDALVESGGYLDYDRPLVIAGISYDGWSARLELSEPRPNSSRIVARLLRDAANHQQRGGI